MTVGVGAAHRRPGFAASVGWSGIGVALSGSTRFAYSALVGHLAGTIALGAVNAELFLALLAVQAGPNAVGAAAVKFVAQAQGRAETAEVGEAAGAAASIARTWHQVLVWGVALAVVCAAAAGMLAVSVLHRSAAQGALVAALVVSTAAYSITRGARFAAGDFARAALAEAAAAIVSLALLVVVLLGGDLSLALAPLVVGYALYAVIMWPRRAAPRGGRCPGAGVEPAELASFLRWSVVGGLASAGLLQASVVIADTVDGAQQVGQYAAAVAVSTPMALLATPLFQTLFSSLARSAGRADAAAVRIRTDAATRALVVVMVAVGGGLVLVARTAVGVMGPDLGAAVPLVHVVALSVLVSTLTVPAVASLTSGSGKGMRTVALTSASGLLAGLTVMAFAAPSWGAWGLGAGVDGVAVGYAVGTVTTNVALWCLAWRRHTLAWGRLSAKVVLALGVLIVLVGLPWAATITGGWVLGVAFVLVWLVVNASQIRALLRPGAPPRRAAAPRSLHQDQGS